MNTALSTRHEAPRKMPCSPLSAPVQLIHPNLISGYHQGKGVEVSQ